jgi:hypothetical protein
MKISFKNFERLCYQSKNALQYSTQLRIDEDMQLIKWFGLLVKMHKLLLRQTPFILETDTVRISSWDYQRLMYLASYAVMASKRRVSNRL